jgi:hypothetical protein
MTRKEEKLAYSGWKQLTQNCSAKGEGRFPIPAYSEFMPPPRFGCRPYRGILDRLFFSEEDPAGWPVTELEEALEIRPGMENIAQQVLTALLHLAKGEPAEGLARNKLANNPYWPPDLAERSGQLKQERFVIILPLALSRTQDDKGRIRWTFFGGSEQGPSRPFWKGFFDSAGKEISQEKTTAFIGNLLGKVYGEPAENLKDLFQAGFRLLALKEDAQRDHLPSWTASFLWRSGMPLAGMKYLLSFEPFGQLPPEVKEAYLAERLHLLPFPGSLLFWGVPGYHQLQQELPMAGQIPLLHLVERHEAPHGLRVPQSGWIYEPRPGQPFPPSEYGPIRSTFKRTHRWARVHRHENELDITPREDKILHVLFGTQPDELNLYGKPMAQNSQVWTQDYRLVLDGPKAAREEVQEAIHTIKQGGLFGYRFFYPPMGVGDYQVYWHRPVMACLSREGKAPSILFDAPLGYLTAYPSENPDLNHPVELWPRVLNREIQQTLLELLKDHPHESPTLHRISNLLTGWRLFRKSRVQRSFARQLLRLPRDKRFDDWLDSLPAAVGNGPQGKKLVGQLRGIVEPNKNPLSRKKEEGLPPSLTYESTALRGFEVRYWKDIEALSTGRYLNQSNSDCILDRITQSKLKHNQRDLEKLGDFLLSYYRRVVAGHGLKGKARVGDLPFKWRTVFDFEWWGGWMADQEGRAEERNLMVIIPGRDRRRAVIMADHYDTAYMENVYYRDQGGSGARLSAPGADDNHSATAALMRAAPILCELSREGLLGCDVWLVHLTGEEFPADCLGARHLCQQLVEGTLKLRLADGRWEDLSKVRVQGVFVLDMIAHNNDHERDVFQVSPGTGAEGLWLAYQAHLANEAWNASALIWNQHPSRRGCGRGRRIRNKESIPPLALHPQLEGQVRLPRDPRSTLYNTDGQIFSDSGIPVVLFMENYDLHRQGYHDTHDTMENIDLDYGSALAAIAIEAVARAATEKPILPRRGQK